MRRYAIVIEDAGDNYSGYVPDLPVCIATGDTPDEVADLLRQAVDLYLESLRDDGLPLPEPSSTVDARVIEVAI